VTKPLSDLAHFQRRAAEKRRLLELGQIRVETTRPDTRALTRQVQAAASSPKKEEPSQR
jgi:hypothetical protein